MFLQGNLAGELFSGTLLSRTEPESVPSSMGKKSSDRRRLAIKPKFVDRFCYHFDQFALTFSNNILWRKNQKAKKRCPTISRTNFTFQFGTKRSRTVFREKMSEKKAEKIFFNSFSQNSSFTEKFSSEKDFHTTKVLWELWRTSTKKISAWILTSSSSW